MDEVQEASDWCLVKEEFNRGLRGYFTIEDEEILHDMDEVFNIIEVDCSGVIEYERICKNRHR